MELSILSHFEKEKCCQPIVGKNREDIQLFYTIYWDKWRSENESFLSKLATKDIYLAGDWDKEIHMDKSDATTVTDGYKMMEKVLFKK